MFHIIIIDDEKTIRDGICRHIKRAYPNLCLDGAFADGKEAIEFLKNNKVDIVVTDIKMSEKSGIDVAKFLHESGADSKVIFLSGYQEFEYAKQAIQYNVKYYLPKPVKLTELNEALDELINQLLSKRLESTELEKEKQYLQSLLSFVKHDFYSDILLGILEQKDEIIQRAAKIGLADNFLPETQCAVFSVTVTNAHAWHYEYDDLYTSIQNLMREVTGLRAAIPITQEKHKILYIGEFSGYASAEALNESLSANLNTILQNASDLLHVTFLYDVLFCGKDIFSLADYRIFSHENSSKSVLLEDKYKDLLSRILSNDKEGARNLLDKIQLYTQDLTLEESRTLLLQLFQKFSDSISTNLQHSLSPAFNDGNTKEELFLQAQRLLESIFNHISENAQGFENETITRAKQFIKEHYAEDIGLEDVAGFVYLNPVYFSRFFKQYTDMTMTDYLTSLRIEHAIELLKEHKCKIHEVSKACGYKSSKYFAKIFKQCTGLTPSEFSKLH